MSSLPELEGTPSFIHANSLPPPPRSNKGLAEVYGSKYIETGPSLNSLPPPRSPLWILKVSE